MNPLRGLSLNGDLRESARAPSPERTKIQGARPARPTTAPACGGGSDAQRRGRGVRQQSTRKRARSARGPRSGFSLLEVMIAMAILALSLTVLLNSNVSAIASVERIEGMTAATLLARAKMLDLERQLNKEGFKADEEERDGDFEDEGHPQIKWAAKIMPIKVQTEKIMDMASGFASGMGTDKDKAASAGASMGMADPMGFLGPLITPVAQGISDNMRLVSLDVSWPEGKRRSKFTVNAIVTSRALKQVIQQPQPGMPGAPGGSGITGPRPLP